MKADNINIDEYDYALPENRIAQFPAGERDSSKLLLYDGENISSDIFRNLDRYIPGNSLLVFNNTRVIRARLFFSKLSGAVIEILCIEPLSPPEYEKSFSSTGPVEWKCIIGNLKKWKTGKLNAKFMANGSESLLSAEKIHPEGEAWRIKFSWENGSITFSDVIEASGHVPLPPYINRKDDKKDLHRYQTIYSAVNGSVAAPTAGLHFTANLLKRISEKGAGMVNITLHVGAGTFQPVRTACISNHRMHCEHFYITRDAIKCLIDYQGRIIATGTTSVRAIESIYWLGVKAYYYPDYDIDNFKISQWEPYNGNYVVPAKDSLTALYNSMTKNRLSTIKGITQMMIIPGYKFMLTDGIITNFHQPRSTLLLLISAWTGSDWKKIYNYALQNEFRFLSYGDSSFMYNPHNKRII